MYPMIVTLKYCIFTECVQIENIITVSNDREYCNCITLKYCIFTEFVQIENIIIVSCCTKYYIVLYYILSVSGEVQRRCPQQFLDKVVQLQAHGQAQ